MYTAGPRPAGGGTLAGMAVSFSLAGRSCLDPQTLRDSYTRAGIPTDWYGKANRYINLLGLTPGRGHLLLKLSDLHAIGEDIAKPLDLVIYDTNTGTGGTFPGIRIVGHPKALDYGASDYDPAYLVEISDRRIDCALGALSTRYNFRLSPDADRETVSLNSGLAWEWAALYQELWTQVGNLGPWPGLPAAAPDLTTHQPEQVDCHGHRAADLLEDLLAMNGMAVSYDAQADTFSIVYLAEDDTPATQAFQALFDAQLLIWDDCPFVPRSLPTPAYARVLFPVWVGLASPDIRETFVVDVADPIGLTTKTAGAVYLQDPQPARLWERVDDPTNPDSSVVIEKVDNTSALAYRAKVVARIFYDRFSPNKATTPIRRCFTGFHAPDTLRPGKHIDVAVWSDLGTGPMTMLGRAGRLGTAELRSLASPQTSGKLLNTYPNDTILRVAGSTDANASIVRAGGLPPSQDRLKEAVGWNAGADSYPLNFGGLGVGPLMRRAGSLRQGEWSIVGVGGGDSSSDDGSRLWKQRVDNNTNDLRFVKCTGAVDTGSGLYPGEIKDQTHAYPFYWPNKRAVWLWGANDETLENLRNYLARKSEATVLGIPVWHTFCCTGGTPGGVEPPPAMQTGCCTLPIPQTLYGVFEVISGTCTCLDGQYFTLTGDPAAQTWNASASFCAGLVVVGMTITCDYAGTHQFGVTEFNVNLSHRVGYTFAFTCEPFVAVLGGYDVASCPGAVVQIRITNHHP